MCKDGKVKSDSTVEELKTIDNLYELLLPRKAVGFKNLRKLMLAQKEKSPEEANPGTRFHELVEALEEYFDK